MIKKDYLQQINDHLLMNTMCVLFTIYRFAYELIEIQIVNYASHLPALTSYFYKAEYISKSHLKLILPEFFVLRALKKVSTSILSLGRLLCLLI